MSIYIVPECKCKPLVADLLAALKNVTSWIENWNPDFECDPEWPADRDAARAAIARAEGGAK